jgi:hypothetical protein
MELRHWWFLKYWSCFYAKVKAEGSSKTWVTTRTIKRCHILDHNLMNCGGCTLNRFKSVTPVTVVYWMVLWRTSTNTSTSCPFFPKQLHTNTGPVTKFLILYRTHQFITRFTWACILSQLNPLHTLTPCNFEIHFNIILISMPRFLIHILQF